MTKQKRIKKAGSKRPPDEPRCPLCDEKFMEDVGGNVPVHVKCLMACISKSDREIKEFKTAITNAISGKKVVKTEILLDILANNC